MESAELAAILNEVRDRVRARNPETAAGVGIPLPDLMPLVHARDAAMGKVAAIGTVNPRAGGVANSLVQAWKRLVARVLDWHVREQVEFNRKVVACVDAAVEALRDQNRALSEMGSRLDNGLAGMGGRLDNGLAEMGNRLDNGFARLAALEQLAGEMRDMRTHWAEWRPGWEHKLAENEMQFLRSVADLQGAFAHRVTLMEASHRDLMRGQNTDFHAALERHGFDIQKRMWADLEKMRWELERTIHAELRLIRQRTQMAAPAAASTAPSPTTPAPVETALAFDYARFAERFRGSEEHVKQGQQFYRPYFEGCQTVLDIGCGRGEFLELMRGTGVAARGIDLSDESVALCRLKGLEAEKADVFTYLAGVEEESLDGIFCAQVVEHLPPERLPELVRLCASRLARHGVIAIETPNPECLAIFATHFYLDPTHARPIPHPLLRFYLEEFGVGEIQLRRLSPALETMPALGSLPEDFRNAFFGELDYALIGRKL